MLSNMQLRRMRLAASVARYAPRDSGSAAQALAIEQVQAWPVREPSGGRRYTVLRLRTKSGVSGFGECAGVSPSDLAFARERLSGAVATGYEVIDRSLAGRPGVRGAVNMALLDLVGKAAKAPVYQVLGGPTRFRVRALSTLEGATDEALVAALGRAERAGFRCHSVPVPATRSRNQGQAFVLATRSRLEALRAAAPDSNLVLDAAGALTPGDAANLAEALERFHLLWFDEPCRVSNVGVVAKVAGENVTPLGFGRTLAEPGVFQDLLRESAIDVLRPDISAHGISQIRRLAVMAETWYVAVAPYHAGGPIATAAALHLAACLPNSFAQQIPLPEADADRRMRAELAGRAVETVKDGYAELPAGPGLGIDVEESVLEKYRERS